MVKQPQRWHKRHRTWLMLSGALVLIFIVANVVVALAYHSRTYPHTSVLSTDVSNMSLAAARAKLQHDDPLPSQIKLAYQQHSAQVKPTDLGMHVDLSKLRQVAKQGSAWLPLANFFTKHTLDAPLRFDQTTYNQAVSQLAPTFHQAVTGAHLATQNGKITVVQAAAGYQLDTHKLQAALAKSITSKTVIVPVTALPPTKLADPNKTLKAIQGQLNTSLTFQFNDKTAKASQADIASWYMQSGNDLVVSDAAVRDYIVKTGAKLGVNPQNADQATNTTLDALKNSRATTVKLFARVKTFTYCLQLKGVSASNMPELQKRAAEAYNDPRGWGAGGQVVFKQVSSGCDFTIWLTASNQMTGFGSICDPVWSCTVPPNVIINFDRWQNATDSWNAAHAGTIEQYRIMAINHESGHEMGFGHVGCPGPGQPAPVMQQQSVDLQGCTFNIWPTATEQNNLRVKLGL